MPVLDLQSCEFVLRVCQIFAATLIGNIYHGFGPSPGSAPRSGFFRWREGRLTFCQTTFGDVNPFGIGGRLRVFGKRCRSAKDVASNVFDDMGLGLRRDRILSCDRRQSSVYFNRSRDGLQIEVAPD